MHEKAMRDQLPQSERYQRRIECSLLGLRRLVRRARLLTNRAAVELGLLLARLEPTVAELGRGVDELQVNDLNRHTAHLRKEGLPQGQDAATWPHGLALDHHP